jgi:hypothetical protein
MRSQNTRSNGRSGNQLDKKAKKNEKAKGEKDKTMGHYLSLKKNEI